LVSEWADATCSISSALFMCSSVPARTFGRAGLSGRLQALARAANHAEMGHRAGLEGAPANVVELVGGPAVDGGRQNFVRRDGGANRKLSTGGADPKLSQVSNLPCCVFVQQGTRSDHHGHDWQDPAFA
jgi:hypothetical protein